MLDKSSFCGGNSTKATSGINGANSRTQRDKGIKDSADLFTSDTLKGGVKKPELAKVLCENSGADIEWISPWLHVWGLIQLTVRTEERNVSQA